MFIQVMQGQALDSDALRKQLDVWLERLAPGATGWLGTTAGITEDGRFIASARFESSQDARRNSDRPEQDAWWKETSRLIDSHRLHDCGQVDEYDDGGSDDAGFVQVIQGRVTDVEEYRLATKDLGSETSRPDVIGGVIAWDGSFFTEFVYFTSEEEARAGESKPESEVALEKRWSLTQDLEYFDLKEPWLASP